MKHTGPPSRGQDSYRQLSDGGNGETRIPAATRAVARGWQEEAEGGSGEIWSWDSAGFAPQSQTQAGSWELAALWGDGK